MRRAGGTSHCPVGPNLQFVLIFPDITQYYPFFSVLLRLKLWLCLSSLVIYKINIVLFGHCKVIVSAIKATLTLTQVNKEPSSNNKR